MQKTLASDVRSVYFSPRMSHSIDTRKGIVRQKAANVRVGGFFTSSF